MFFASFHWLSVLMWPPCRGSQTLLPVVLWGLVDLLALLFRYPGCVASCGLLLLPSGGWMHTASSTVCKQNCLAWVIWPSRVGQSTISCEFDWSLNQPGRLDISVLCLLHSGEQLESLWLKTLGFWPTASSNSWLPLHILWHPRESCWHSVLYPPQYRLLLASPGLLRVHSRVSVSSCPSPSGHTPRAGYVRLSGLWSLSVGWWSGRGDCTPSTQFWPARYASQPSVASAEVPPISGSSHGTWCCLLVNLPGVVSLFDPPLTAELHVLGSLIWSLQWIIHISSCQLYVSISNLVSVRGTATMCRLPRYLAIVADVAGFPFVQWVPARLWPLQCDGASRLQGNNPRPAKISTQVLSKHWVFTFHTCAISGWIRHMITPGGGNAQRFPSIHIHLLFFTCNGEICINFLKGIQRFRFKN